MCLRFKLEDGKLSALEKVEIFKQNEIFSKKCPSEYILSMVVEKEQISSQI